MLHGIYFRLYRFTHNKLISVMFARLIYAVFFCKYLKERIRYKKRVVDIKEKDALDIISKCHPNPIKNIQYKLPNEDTNIDLSIIVPVYNYADLIENNIESILNQRTKYSYQLILVDDGSTDGARDVLHKYIGYPNVKVIFQENQGIAGARNTGLSYATGKYIMFIDCDDTVEDNLVDTLMDRAYRDDCDIVMCAHNLVKEKDGKIYEILPNIYPTYNLQGYADKAKILNYAGLPWCKVYRRKLWEQVQYLPGCWYEDTIIHCLLFTQCEKFAYEPVVCYQYRWYEKNFSHTQGKSENPKCIDMYWVMKHILEQYEWLGFIKDERFETMLLKHLSSYYYSTISGLQKDIVDALFVLACELYEQHGAKREYKLPYMLQITKKALEQRDINLWMLATKYQK